MKVSGVSVRVSVGFEFVFLVIGNYLLFVIWDLFFVISVYPG